MPKRVSLQIALFKYTIMDKNKVKQRLSKVEENLLAYEKTGKRIYLTAACVKLHDAQEEVDKSDWISVDDELPDYEESVLVASSEDTEEIYFSHRTKRPDVVVENNGFTTFVGAPKITHWQRIKKLEE